MEKLTYTMDVAFFQKQWFPDNIENEIDTLQFLDASKGLVWLVEQFGFVFEPVKKDLLGNIEKLNKKYSENTEEFNCLMRMILHEYRQGERYAIESLLWLRRGLAFMKTFLTLFIENEKKGLHNENMCNLMAQAYEQTLKAHHGWATRFLFGMLQGRCPSRSEFLTIIGQNEIQDEKLLISLLDNYLEKLASNLEVLIIFCQKHDIKPYH